jgi:hypothetical protein
MIRMLGDSLPPTQNICLLLEGRRDVRREGGREARRHGGTEEGSEGKSLYLTKLYFERLHGTYNDVFCLISRDVKFHLF